MNHPSSNFFILTILQNQKINKKTAHTYTKNKHNYKLLLHQQGLEEPHHQNPEKQTISLKKFNQFHKIKSNKNQQNPPWIGRVSHIFYNLLSSKLASNFSFLFFFLALTINLTWTWEALFCLSCPDSSLLSRHSSLKNCNRRVTVFASSSALPSSPPPTKK